MNDWLEEKLRVTEDKGEKPWMREFVVRHG